MFRHAGVVNTPIGDPAKVPLWTGPLRYLRHSWDKEITALREDAWQSYLRNRPDLLADAGRVELAREAFMAAFHVGSRETAARVLRILEYEEGFTEPMHHDAMSGVSVATVQRITDEFGLETKGKHA